MKTSRSGPGRVTVDEAAERTGFGREDKAAGHVEASLVLDVREPGEWQAGHVPGAVHIPLAELSEGIPLPTRAQERPLIVICRSGNRSRRAAELLTARGAKAVDVIGGMLEWAEAGLPVVDSQGLRGTVA
ncbi:rhodanese-like domain-containing protein [Streptomyces sp. NBC_00631]|uniref:rhodanese-like domain-containing protein n=1 Tax=Streptomyces sp. NBC_00631 TaxID=2975793 RepID=UPI0030E23615